VPPIYVVVVCESDPVAALVAREWGTPPSTGEHVDGVPLRRLGEHRLELRRAVPHIHDEGLDRRLPAAVRDANPILVFPSIHRSEQNIACLTVHPVGNLGPSAELGGRPSTVTPAEPRSMTAVLRRLSEEGSRAGLSATFEATHHGPELGLRAFFVEIGYGAAPTPPEPAVRILARAIREFAPDPHDHVALGVGGGHYAPHFTELALHRAWAFGHIVSRHALESLDPATARAAYAATDGAEGILYARAQDANHPALAGLGPRLRDSAAPGRAEPPKGEGPTPGVRPAGT
jgi:D-tyrosyl-tRNA(Tyr) deacylase